MFVNWQWRSLSWALGLFGEAAVPVRIERKRRKGDRDQLLDLGQQDRVKSEQLFTYQQESLVNLWMLVLLLRVLGKGRQS